VAYAGENVIMEDNTGAGFVSWVFAAHGDGYQRLGDMYRKAQQDYFNAVFFNANYHGFDPAFS
jgi:hypothetical protein